MMRPIVVLLPPNSPLVFVNPSKWSCLHSKHYDLEVNFPILTQKYDNIILVDISPPKKTFTPPPQKKKSPIHCRHPPGPRPHPVLEPTPPSPGIFNKKNRDPPSRRLGLAPPRAEKKYISETSTKLWKNAKRTDGSISLMYKPPSPI